MCSEYLVHLCHATALSLDILKQGRGILILILINIKLLNSKDTHKQENNEILSIKKKLFFNKLKIRKKLVNNQNLKKNRSNLLSINA